MLTGSKDRKSNTSTDIKDRQGANLVWRLNNLRGDLKEENYYRIPLEYLLSLGLVYFAYQLDTRFIFRLETNLNRLFESNAKANIPDAPDAQIIFHDTPYISYPQIKLTDNFLVYANGVLRVRGALRTDVLLDPYQQSFDVNKGIRSIKIDFKGLNRQIEWLEISLVYDKSDQHLTIYDSYDVELAAKCIKKITLENVQKTYSPTGKLNMI